LALEKVATIFRKDLSGGTGSAGKLFKRYEYSFIQLESQSRCYQDVVNLSVSFSKLEASSESCLPPRKHGRRFDEEKKKKKNEL